MGEITEAVKVGVEVIKLVANSAGSYIDQSKYVSALPPNTDGSALGGWQFKKAGLRWTQATDSSWYEFWEVEWDYTVGMKWAHHGQDTEGGLYVDQATLTLDVGHVPPDFTLTVTQHFPKGPLNLGPPGDPTGAIWALQSTITIEAKGFLGQLVSWTKNLDCLISGDGTWQMS